VGPTPLLEQYRARVEAEMPPAYRADFYFVHGDVYGAVHLNYTLLSDPATG
jgi:hypothetical protein